MIKHVGHSGNPDSAHNVVTQAFFACLNIDILRLEPLWDDVRIESAELRDDARHEIGDRQHVEEEPQFSSLLQNNV